MTVSFTRADFRLPMRPFTLWYRRSPQANQVVGVLQIPQLEPESLFGDSTSAVPPPPLESLGASTHAPPTRVDSGSWIGTQVASIGSPERSRSNREDYIPRSRPDDNGLRYDTTCGAKIVAFRRKSWNRWFSQCDQCVSEPTFRVPLRNRTCWRVCGWFGGRKG